MTVSKIPVLDHGYVELIESWGSDERIIEAARMSTNKGFLGWGPSTYIECVNPSCVGYSYQGNGIAEEVIFMRCPQCSSVLVINKDRGRTGDEKLLRYLYEHKHATPFEMAGLTIEVQAPIFVFREWHRHRTQSYNEMSARYTPLPDLNYTPTVERLMLTASSNKQAQSTGKVVLSESEAYDWLCMYSRQCEMAQVVYEQGLALGVPKELARLIVPVSRYSKMRASANLRNWLAFLTLRMDLSAQYEIRQYANVVGSIISGLFPRTWELFSKERSNV